MGRIPEVALDWSMFDTDTVKIEQRIKNGISTVTGEATFGAPVTLYNGPASTYSPVDDVRNTPSASLAIAEDIFAVISGPTLPTGVAEGDRVTITQSGTGVSRTYLAKFVHYNMLPPKSVLLHCTLQDAW